MSTLDPDDPEPAFSEPAPAEVDGPVTFGEWVDDDLASAEVVADLPLFEELPIAEVVAPPRRERPIRDMYGRIFCSRCELLDTPTRIGSCRQCGVRLVHRRPRPRPRPRRRPDPRHAEQVKSVGVVMVFFMFLLLLSALWAGVLLSSAGKMTEDQLMKGTAILEVIDTAMVVFVLLILGRISFPHQEPETRILVWVSAVPLLGIMLVANVLYTAFFRELLKLGGPPPGPAVTPLLILLICIQPAIVEELFFRYTALGVLKRASGMHAAVWITAAMFAVIHITNPIGMPYLFVLGVLFGYARVWGGLALPMVMHFFHNLIVTVAM